MYTVYKTVNLVNGKFYIGVHKTDNPLDEYLGSGKLLRRAISRYGRENFIKYILLITSCKKEAFEKELELVTSELVESELCYNLKIGGEGGFDYINAMDLTLRNREISKNRNYHDPIYLKKLSENVKISKSDKNNPNNYLNWTGRTHSIESKQKMSAAKRNLGCGSSNSQYGTCWITNGVDNKKWHISNPIPDGWRRGRINNK